MSIRMDVTPPRVVLENEFLEIFFVADRGLELAFLKDKKTKQKLTGIEFEGKKTAFFAKVCDETENEFLRAYEYEEENGLLWQVDFHLPEKSQVLIAHVVLMNDTTEEISVDWSMKHRIPDEYRQFFSKLGKKWQAAVYEDGTGYFFRMTLDFEVTNMVLKPGEICQFTCCYGRLELDVEDVNTTEESYTYACVKTAVNVIMPDDKLLKKQGDCGKCSNYPCTKLLYTGSGWGALEQIRRMKENLPLFPQQYFFPVETIGEEQQEELKKML